MDKEYGELEENYVELAARLRAKYLENFLILEDLLTEIIALYFCAEAQVREQFYSILYPELFYRKKVKILYEIIYPRFPQELDGVKPTRDELESFNTFRNTLIHSMLDRLPDYIERQYTDRIRIRKYNRGNINLVEIEESEIDEKIEKMQGSYLLLTNIKSAIEIDRDLLGVYAGGAGVVPKEDS